MNLERGQIYFVNLNPVQGKEQSGKRPVLILSIDEINRKQLVITIIPGTDGANIKRDYSTNVRASPAESGLQLETVFLCFQVRALAPSRFLNSDGSLKPLSGKLSPNKMREIEASVRYVLGL
jgi:mRNA interferase MazF